MGIDGILRIEQMLMIENEQTDFDPMLQQKYSGIDQDIFSIPDLPKPIEYIENISLYNESEGLALSNDEVIYLEEISNTIGRKLTDSENIWVCTN